MSYHQQAPQAPKQKHTARNGLIIASSALGALALIGIAFGGNDVKAPVSDTLPNVVTTTAPVEPTVAATTEVPATTEPTVEATTEAPKPTKTTPKMTASQEQAVGSAESYLDFTAFSRKGLIRQLSSEAGEGFSVKDATYAVDHIKVNWNEQAAKSAEAYLKMTHFSRSGLIRQLESSAGEGFTHAQAVYGVNKAGL